MLVSTIKHAQEEKRAVDYYIGDGARFQKQKDSGAQATDQIGRKIQIRGRKMAGGGVVNVAVQQIRFGTRKTAADHEKCNLLGGNCIRQLATSSGPCERGGAKSGVQ